MKFEVSIGDLEEMISTIFNCGLSERESIKYAKEFIREINSPRGRKPTAQEQELNTAIELAEKVE